MKIEVPTELLFPMGETTPLTADAVQDFIGLARKASSNIVDRQQIIEKFKDFFAASAGDQYGRSSNLSWAESDLEYHADRASLDAPGFIAAFCNACDALEEQGVAVPSHLYVNNLLDKHSVPFRVTDHLLVTAGDHISPPDPVVWSAESTVSRALSDAKILLGYSESSSAIDRVHTALHGYLLELCDGVVQVEQDAPLPRLFKLLRQSHPALAPRGPRGADVTKILQSFAGAIDALSTIRNRASLAHANDLLDEPEATIALNAVYTVFRYIQDCVKRHEK